MLERTSLIVFVLVVLLILGAYLLGIASIELVALLIGLLFVIEVGLNLWDRFRPQKTEKRPAAPDEEQYLRGRLNAFKQEEDRFIALAGEAIETRFEAYSAAFLTSHPGQPLKEYTDVADAVNDYRQFVIVGDPGTGKSTSLRYLASKAAQARLESKRVPLPLWIDLGSSANPPDAEQLLDYWWSEYGLPGDAKRALINADVWLFLDGLNEMPEQEANRAERAKSLKNLLDTHPHVRAIVTCRVRNYEGDLRLGDLPLVRISPLDIPRIEMFVRLRLPGQADDFLREVKVNDALMRMARKPYTLAMLSKIYGYRQLPTNLNDLYRIYIEETYKRDAKRGLLHLKWRTLECRLQRLAFRMIVRGKGTAAEVKWSQRQIGLRALEDGINLGVLVQDGREETVRFYHQTLHGYFALPELTRALQPHWLDGIHRYRLESLFRGIADLGEAAAPTAPALIERLHDESDWMRRQAAWALGMIGTPAVEAVPALSTALRDPDWQVRLLAAVALRKIGAAAAEAVPALRDALHDPDEGIQRRVARALEHIGTPEARAALEAWQR